jgi:hypothetical protein
LPHSWLRISSETSRRLRHCLEGKSSKSKVNFRDCLNEVVVVVNGGRVDALLFEQNGKFARALVYWHDQNQKKNIIFDTEAEDLGDIGDFLTPEQVDELADDRSVE